MFRWLTKGVATAAATVATALGASVPVNRSRNLRAKIDAAQTTPDNRRHWANTDSLAADAAFNPQVRAALRDRGRYEQFNNPMTDGQLQTLSSDIVGRGPRLQMLTGIDEIDSVVESEFHDWADAVNLGQKLRLAIETRAAAGECFGIKSTNPRLRTPVKLDVTLIEGDQCATPDLWQHLSDSSRTDGIVFDRYNNPLEYHILRQHPGDTRYLGTGVMGEYDRVPAANVIHFLKKRRPGQRRGIPQITSSLPLFAERRGFRQSVLAAARKAAELGAIVLETAGNPETDDPPVPFEEVELESGLMTTLPGGAKASQIKAEQPASTFREFDDKLINEGARPLNMPFNVAACDSSKYNYASGRLDHQTYDRSIDVDHGDLELEQLDTILRWWLDEALRIEGYLPERARQIFSKRIAHQWLWRGREHVDPTKEAEAQRIRLESRTASLSDELVRGGKDIETHLAQLAREETLKARLRLTHNKPLAGPQILAAINVLKELRAGTIPAVAAIELLISLGTSKEWAIVIVGKTLTQEPAEDNVDTEASRFEHRLNGSIALGGLSNA